MDAKTREERPNLRSDVFSKEGWRDLLDRIVSFIMNFPVESE